MKHLAGARGMARGFCSPLGRAGLAHPRAVPPHSTSARRRGACSVAVRLSFQEKRARRRTGPPYIAYAHAQLGTAEGEVHPYTGIGADTAEADVKSAATAEAIATPISLELIAVTLAAKPVSAFASGKLVLAAPAEDSVSAHTGENLIAPASRTDQVVAATAQDLIIAVACHDDVATGRSAELVGAGRSCDRSRETSACRSRGLYWRGGTRVKQGRGTCHDDHDSDLDTAFRP